MFIKSSKIFLPTCLFRPTCRVELDILLCKSTKKYQILNGFWVKLVATTYSMCNKRFKVLQVPCIQHAYFIFKNTYSHQHVYSIQHDYWIRYHAPSNMFIPSNTSIRNTRVREVNRGTMSDLSLLLSELITKYPSKCHKYHEISLINCFS